MPARLARDFDCALAEQAQPDRDSHAGRRRRAGPGLGTGAAAGRLACLPSSRNCGRRRWRRASGTPARATACSLIFPWCTCRRPPREQAGADKGPQQLQRRKSQAEKNDKAVKPATARRRRPSIHPRERQETALHSSRPSEQEARADCSGETAAANRGCGGQKGGGAMMRNVAQAQQRLIVVIVGLAVIDVALPCFPAVAGHTFQQSAAQAEIAGVAAATGGQKRVQAIPALDMDKKLAEARSPDHRLLCPRLREPLFGDFRDSGQGGQRKPRAVDEHNLHPR